MQLQHFYTLSPIIVLHETFDDFGNLIDFAPASMDTFLASFFFAFDGIESKFDVCTQFVENRYDA